MQLRSLLDDLQSNLWFRPTLWVLGLGILAVFLMLVDRRLSAMQANLLLPWFFVSGADGARTMLGAIATSMLTVTTLAFSIMMLTVVQTANAYSPRILRQFLGDTTNQHVLGILIGTFMFALLVLRAVRSTNEASFIPSLAINVALFLSLLSIAAFIFFINHVAHSIAVSNIIRLILSNTEALMNESILNSTEESWTDQQSPRPPDVDPAVVTAEENGYVQYVDSERLLRDAVDGDVVVQVELMAGDYVLTGMPLAYVWPAESLEDELVGRLRKAVRLEDERTMVQDLRFGVRQLSDIALRALSPGINDPNTALNCINALATLLGKMARLDPSSPYHYDDEGELRVIAPTPTFASLLNLAFNQIRHYGAGDVTVMVRLLEISSQIGYFTSRPERCRALWQQAQEVAEAARRSIKAESDRARIAEQLQKTAKVLGYEVEE